MASGSAIAIYHSTLAAATVETVTLTGANYRNIEIVNRGTVDIFATTDGTTAPTVAGAETWVIPAGSSTVLLNGKPSDETANFPALPISDISHGDTTRYTTVVKLISSATPPYTVSGKPLTRSI